MAPPFWSISNIFPIFITPLFSRNSIKTCFAVAVLGELWYPTGPPPPQFWTKVALLVVDLIVVFALLHGKVKMC